MSTSEVVSQPVLQEKWQGLQKAVNIVTFDYMMRMTAWLWDAADVHWYGGKLEVVLGRAGSARWGTNMQTLTTGVPKHNPTIFCITKKKRKNLLKRKRKNIRSNHVVLPCRPTAPVPSIKFHCNPGIHNFLSNVAYKQTDKQTKFKLRKHTILCQRGTNGCLK